MRLNLAAVAFFASASAGLTQQAQSSQEIVAACNVQVGQALTALGQSQQQIIALQAQIADLQKQIADLKSDQDKKTELPKQ